ncbi:MAG: endonuclease/exonuclease/phosphatase family protein [Phycisphaerae bacterium]|nr:endonuclease/exonuclease/phosphatase family protein [Phycisphaerae bacterium]
MVRALRAGGIVIDDSAPHPPAPHRAPHRALTRLAYLFTLVTVGVFASGQLLGGMTEALISPWPAPLCTALALAVVGLVALRRRWPAAAAALVLAWALVVWAAPLLARPVGDPVAAQGAGPERRLRIIEANVNSATRPDPRLIDWMRAAKPDVLVVIECSNDWLQALADALPDMPHRKAHAQDDPGGIALFSRHSLRSAVVADTPAEGFMHIEAVVETAVGPVRVFAMHTVPPITPRLTRMRNAELEWLAARVAQAQGETVLAVGDLNETPWGTPYARLLRTSGLHSASDAPGLHGTWHRAMPSVLRIPIDHCLVSSDVTSVGFSVGPQSASDHLPIQVDLVLPHPKP